MAIKIADCAQCAYAAKVDGDDNLYCRRYPPVLIGTRVQAQRLVARDAQPQMAMMFAYPFAPGLPCGEGRPFPTIGGNSESA